MAASYTMTTPRDIFKGESRAAQAKDKIKKDTVSGAAQERDEPALVVKGVGEKRNDGS